MDDWRDDEQAVEALKLAVDLLAECYMEPILADNLKFWMTMRRLLRGRARAILEEEDDPSQLN